MKYLLLLILILQSNFVFAQFTETESVLIFYACKQGDKAACYESAMTSHAFAIPEGSRDFKLPMLRDEARCAANIQDSCARLGKVLSQQQPQNPRHFDLLSRACDKGVGWACPALRESVDMLQMAASSTEYDNALIREYYEALSPHCDAGDLTACVNLARLNPVLPFVRPEKAIFLDGLKPPCRKGNARACTQLGYIYSGDADEYEHLMPNFRSSQRRSQRYSRKGCHGGNPTACYNYGMDQKVWADEHEYYARACKGGESLGCEEIRYESFWRRSDSIEDLDEGCKTGDFQACLYIAEKNAKPIRSKSKDPADVARAEAYFKALDRICRMGSGDACGYAAALLAGLNPDRDREMSYSEAGCAVQTGNACYGVGVRLEQGGKPAQAIHYYQLACESLDFAPGCTATGVMHDFARGTEKNDEIAARFYSIGCDRKDARGCNNLSVMLKKSEPKESKRLAKRACKLAKRYCPE